jgi:hypothetical protein
MQTLSATPHLQLETLFILDDRGRIISTREPLPSPGPVFMLIRGEATVDWAIRADVADGVADELNALARQESASTAWEQPPVHARRYQEAVGGHVSFGPAFEFPNSIQTTGIMDEVVEIHDEARLHRHFSGWIAGEIEAGAAPMIGVLSEGEPVSVCFCARRSEIAAEAGLETALAFRGRGYAPFVTAAWAASVRAGGRIPLYSTDWTNAASLAVARKLGLRTYAADWSISG